MGRALRTLSRRDFTACELPSIRAYIALTLLDIVKTLGPGRGRSGTREGFAFTERFLTDTAAIASLIEPAVKALGLDLVRVAMIGGKSDPTLQVMAERPDTRQLTIDDCADLSRAISEILDPLEEAGQATRSTAPTASKSRRPGSTAR